MSKTEAHEKIILEARNLEAWFGDFQAVKGISVAYSEKTINAIIGPSGCGKSTYLRCLNRIHEEIEGTKVHGEVLLEGKNIYDKKIDDIREIWDLQMEWFPLKYGELFYGRII